MKPQIQKLLTVLFVFFSVCLTYVAINGITQQISLYTGFVILVVILSAVIDYAKRDSMLLLFLILFFVAEALSIRNFENKVLKYFILNGLCVLAYLSLIYWLLMKNNIKAIVLRNKLLTVAMFLASAVVFYFFTIKTLTDRVEFLSYMHLMEAAYNLVILILLNIIVLNYAYFNDTKKRFFSFLFCLCLVISEIIQLAYYLSREMMANFSELLIVICLFKLVAFWFCFKYALLSRKVYKPSVILFNE